ncbi:MAG: hypothetical protein ABEJ03_05675 [Candidatus Nanohaloarchaea archaeon]
MSFQVEIDHAKQKNRSVQDLPEKTVPGFVEAEPDLDLVESRTDLDYEKLIVIGNGGSITSFRAFFYAFISEVDTEVRLVTTTDPDYLNRISKETSSEDTLVVAVSKSGETATVVESLLYFLKRDYDAFAVTSDNEGALREIVERKDLDWIAHRDVGGRFSGLTETALAPAALAGIDVREIRKGGEQMYRRLSPEKNYNPALNVASALYDAQKRGFNEVFAGFYSSRMLGFKPLLVQLMHETVCKQGEGQTVFGGLGPEFQHHTNQRIFGGRENVIPLFFTTDTHEREHLEVDEDISDVEIRGRKLGDLDGMEMQESVMSEYRGVRKVLEERDRPHVNLNLTELSHEGAGELMAFLQYLAVYSAWLRDVNPFDQPDVERSKKIGFESRFEGL